MIEAVAPSGKRYRLHSLQHASSFAKQLQDANELKDAKNFSRAVDPSDLRFHFCENWQGIYNVRFVEKVDTQSGELLESALIWGQPRHSMREFYDCLCVRWPELRAVSFESTFCRFLKDGQRKITGFRVRLARDIPIDEMERRLPLTGLPQQPAAACNLAKPAAAVRTTTAVAATPVRSADASARTITFSASPATGNRMSTCMSMRGDNFSEASHALGTRFAGQLGTSTYSAVTTPTAQAARPHSSEELDSSGAPTLPPAHLTAVPECSSLLLDELLRWGAVF